jgi:hypothetical protein
MDVDQLIVMIKRISKLPESYFTFFSKVDGMGTLKCANPHLFVPQGYGRPHFDAFPKISCQQLSHSDHGSHLNAFAQSYNSRIVINKM